MAHAHAPHESASPVVALRGAVLVLQQERHIGFALEQRPSDVVPVPHHQSQNFIGFVEAVELAGGRREGNAESRRQTCDVAVAGDYHPAGDRRG